MVKKKEKGKSNSAAALRKKIGQRFKMFREVIGKTQSNLGNELNVYQSTITNIEIGKTFPSIKYVDYLGRTYGLSADWLLHERGEMFWRPLPIPISLLDRYQELLDLLRVPVVEQLILARLQEVKALAREDIKAFKAQEGGT